MCNIIFDTINTGIRRLELQILRDEYMGGSQMRSDIHRNGILAGNLGF